MDGDFSKASLLKFIDFSLDKAFVASETGKAWRVAATKLLEDLTEEEEADVRKVDVEIASRRFANRNPGVYTPESLTTYRSRAKAAIEEFISYTNNPFGYKPRGLNGKTRKTEPKSRQSKPVNVPTKMDAPTAAPTQPVLGHRAPEKETALTYPFPIRQDFLAQVTVPRDLTSDEARRLGAFLLALAVDFKPNTQTVANQD